MPGGVGRLHHLRRLEAVEAHQPVRLVEPVLAHQRRALERQDRACVRDRAEGGIIDAPKREAVVERLAVPTISLSLRCPRRRSSASTGRRREARRRLEPLLRIRAFVDG
jgi:hypothetical protein